MEGTQVKKALAGALLLVATLITPQFATAGVFMCVDPATGKKTFTDKACPTRQAGQKVKISGENKRVEIRRGHQGSAHRDRVWNSDRDRSLAGRANLNEQKRVAASVSGNGLLGIGS